MEDFEKAIEEQSQLRRQQILRGFGINEDMLEKGKEAGVGEIRTWMGMGAQQMQKQSDGSWKPVKGKTEKKKKEREKKPIPPAKEDEKKYMNLEKKIKELAKEKFPGYENEIKVLKKQQGFLTQRLGYIPEKK